MGRKVLIVDDVEDTATSFAFLLSDMGHEVQFTTSPVKALKMALEMRPEFVFLDIGMPVIDGWELAKRLRVELGPSVRLFAVSGYARASDYTMSADIGIEEHLPKPIEIARVAEILNTGPRL
jgi:CheY-like chemotaxis protein